MPDSIEIADLTSRLARLEARVARLEADAGFALSSDVADWAENRTPSEESIERELAQKWFARIGIFALAGGGAYLLTLPYPGMPAMLPTLVGWILAGTVAALAHAGEARFALVSAYLRGVAMALLYCATLRLCYFGAVSAIAATSVAAHLLLPAAALLNGWIAWRRRSGNLMAIALVAVAATSIALGDTPSTLLGCALLAVLVAFVGTRPRWGALRPLGAVLVYAVYLTWAAGNPLIGGSYHWVASPLGAPLLLLGCMIVGAMAPLWTGAACDTPAVGLAAAVHGIFGYGVLLIHTYAVSHPWFAATHAGAAAVLLAVAAALWRKRLSEIETFVYAMSAYAALTVAIVHLAALPKVFVWLSLESVVVVATAIWFRSRFIVVTNFVIYVVVVLGYLFLNPRESGISIAFGVVALSSARILNWQRHRLALKTELMRNAYLVSAFVVFPYALFHLATPRFAGFAWVGLALAYYGLNVAIRNQKYRWMAHATLVLTAGYLLVPAHPGMTAAIRIAGFLALGATLLVVSVSSTLVRRRGQ